MSELFTQTNKQKRLFRTEEDIVANIQTQFGMPHTGKDLLLDAKMGPNKDQSSRLDSEPDALSDTGMFDDVGAGDTSGILHDSAGGNKKTITGTNTPRSSRASAYYDLLRSQHKNGHYKAPAYRVVDTIESPLQAGANALNYHDDFDTDAVQNAGLHMAVAQTVVEGNIMVAAADSAFAIGKQAGNILKDLKDETINAKDALKAGGKVLRLQGGTSAAFGGKCSAPIIATGPFLMNSQSHICIATNHPKEEFPPEGIKNFTKCAGARKLRPCFLFYTFIFFDLLSPEGFSKYFNIFSATCCICTTIGL